jgi:hypothetical protein
MATTEDLVGTRLALQAVAEHVLTAALHATTGRIGLRATPGGFGTPWFTPAGVLEDRAAGEPSARRLRVDGVELVAPTDVYTPGTPLDPDEPLFLLPRAAADLARWFTLVDEALASFRAEHAALDPPIAQLWPEHFDLAVSFGEVNYGGSSGDEGHDEPYLYVGPWTPREGAFWNEPFGASTSWTEVPDADAAVAFFREGAAAAAA